MIVWLSAVLLGLVEGVTEFIPVSSTGHLILAGQLLGWHGPRAATFEIFIQLGAILAVVWLYKERFLRLLTYRQRDGFAGMRGLCLLALTTLPALLFGALAHGYIKAHLFNALTVAIGLGVGGVAILSAERFLSRRGRDGLDALQWRDALVVGLFQCLALWPGVSRSAATIIGGMLAGIERRTATEYSFLAAVPVIFAAVAFDLLKSREFLYASDLPIFAVGFVVAFASAWVTVKFFIRLLGSYTLTPFGWYRIAVALAVWLFLQSGKGAL
jgi:undecaprenyl-diphosphatase